MRYRFDVTCPRCGGDVIHAAATPETPVLTLTARAVAHCPKCSRDWLLVLELAPVKPDALDVDLKPCGTEAAYKRHIAHGEPACDQCLFAHRMYKADQPRRPHRKKVPA